MKDENRIEVIELYISITAFIISIFFSVIFKDSTIVAIVSAIVAVSSFYNAVTVFKENINKNELKRIIITNNNLNCKYVSVDELEKIERTFCKNEGKSTIYVVSNNLTADKTQFLDEITANIKNNVTYHYLVSSEMMAGADSIKKEVEKRLSHPSLSLQRKNDVEKLFIITEIKDNFIFCPKKYTVIIYDGGPSSAFNPQALRGFCCAQDDTEYGIFYFEMSKENAKSMLKDITHYLSQEERKK